MQTFKDSATGQIYEYEDDVIATNTAGVYTFKAAHGMALAAPTTLQPYMIPAPTSAQLLSQIKVIQAASIDASYQAAIQLPVTYMATTFQADIDSQNAVTRELVVGSVPANFFWLDASNNQVSMTFAQLQGLALAMQSQRQTAFAKKASLKAQIRASANAAAAQAIIW